MSKAKKRYDTGLEKLEFATQQVNTMQKELEDLQPVLAESQEATGKLMEVIQAKLPSECSQRTGDWSKPHHTCIC